MKKIIVSILAVCYLAVTSGIVMTYHYCMDRLASTSFYGAKVEKCGQCGMELDNSHGCCRDESQFLKLDDDQQQSSVASFGIPAMAVLMVQPSEYIATFFYNFKSQQHFQNHSPPLISGQDTYLQINILRI